jgi:hypothetical protein
MENIELTEEQFTLLKMFCMNNSVAVVCLHPVESDPTEIKAIHTKNLENMKMLLQAGLIKDFNEHCKEALEYAKAHGQRGFDAFSITDQAYKMFSAPEGSVN